MAISSDTRRNLLLAALPDEDWSRWLPHLEPVDLPQGQVLYESGSHVKHVYFPVSGIVSKMYVTLNGATSELAVVGKEGVIGTTLFLGGDTTLNQAVVLSSGKAFRMSAKVLLAEFKSSTLVPHLLLRYTQALMTQMAQTAACNRLHTLDRQLCRWLLMITDRTGSDEILMTHETIANMLGVRREGVTEAAIKLQRDGVIRYARGRILVLDRTGLATRSCECYGVVKREYDRLLMIRYELPATS
ncbi:MAG TPA: Crp/Fnr family transcriptional regulator [Aquabacterium sp.]|uniref:Crp/Fnr family transcriptional regulator n=1 Tax=Aquabacterium sp. TaxID=1872578 RepID=UPI002E380C98|nr:Crp/Fnr family transcriptional regulator [Aquabacterium sp.]HEX5357142.1 Crp/Fnr family transcriptional regulator [Aquabacterium sp.]